jgi:hypothetical protein
MSSNRLKDRIHSEDSEGLEGLLDLRDLMSSSNRQGEELIHSEIFSKNSRNFSVEAEVSEGKEDHNRKLRKGGTLYYL